MRTIAIAAVFAAGFGAGIWAAGQTPQAAWQDADAFFRRQMPTKPTPVDPKLVTNVPIGAKRP